MKMGTIASPWHYDGVAAHAIRPDNQRRTPILCYASWAAVFPISRVVRLPFGCDHFDQTRERRDGPISGVGRLNREQNDLFPDSATFSIPGKFLFELSQKHEPRFMKASERLF